jgi:hypothetical protein
LFKRIKLAELKKLISSNGTTTVHMCQNGKDANRITTCTVESEIRTIFDIQPAIDRAMIIFGGYRNPWFHLWIAEKEQGGDEHAVANQV